MDDNAVLHEQAIGHAHHREWSALSLENTPPARKSSARAVISIEMQVDYRFAFDHEHLGRRMAKAVGLATEYQTGDTEFDKTVYITCDDPEVQGKLQLDGELRTGIQRLLALGAGNITLKDGRLSATFNKRLPDVGLSDIGLRNPMDTGDYTPNLAPGIFKTFAMKIGGAAFEYGQIDEIVGLLYTIKSKLTVLSSYMLGGEVSQAGATRFMVNCFHAIIIGAFVLGILGLVACMATGYHLITYDLYWQKAVPLAAAGVIGLLVLIFGCFHKSSYGYGVFRNFLLFGIVGIVMCACAGFYGVNVLLDKSPAEIHQQKVIRNYISKSSKSHSHKRRTKYHVVVEGWRVGQEPYDFSVSSAVYNNFTPGKTMAVHTHPGVLGYEWVESGN